MEKTIEMFYSFISSPLAEKLLTIFIALIVVIFISRFLKKAVNRHLKDTDRKYSARKMVTVLSYTLILVVIVSVFSDKLGGLGVALGVAGAGIAFALQEVIVSIAGWILIMLSGLIRGGERVRIGDIYGDVIDIGVLKTTLMETGDWVKGDLYNGRLVSVANSFVFKGAVYNYSGEYPFLWDEITVPVRTESDYRLASDLFKKVLVDVCGDYARQSELTWNSLTGKYKVEKAEIEPMVTLHFDENWITFTLRYIVDYKSRRSTKDRIFRRLLEEIAAHSDRISIATAAMEVKSV